LAEAERDIRSEKYHFFGICNFCDHQTAKPENRSHANHQTMNMEIVELKTCEAVVTKFFF